MAENENLSVPILRLTAGELKQINFPQLVRPQIGPDTPPSAGLIHWAIQAYCFPWIRHVSALLNGILLLIDSDNKAAVRIIGRSSYECCAHAYYVQKHLKQHLDRNDFEAAWKFLLPISTGSRYINEFHSTPEANVLFPQGPHISKAVNCFQKEAMPNSDEDDYSYLSEFCHPNMMTFAQHYRWTSPSVIEFGDQVVFGAFGAITASTINGLMAIHELLKMGNARKMNATIVALLSKIAEQHGQS